MKISIPWMITAMVFLMTGVFSHADTIKFSGYDWEIRPSEQNGGPGPNRWDEKNAWVDTKGYLHLKLTQRDGKWYCAEVYTTRSFKFGSYQFWIEGRVDKLDPNVVLGLFNYPESDVGPDGTNEIDIEFAKWGNPSAQNIGSFTVYPTQIKLGQETEGFGGVLMDDGFITVRFTWSATTVWFQSLVGLSDDSTGFFHGMFYHPDNPATHISQSAMPVHINLWCFKGKAPKDGRPVEIIIRAFKFTAK